MVQFLLDDLNNMSVFGAHPVPLLHHALHLDGSIRLAVRHTVMPLCEGVHTSAQAD